MKPQLMRWTAPAVFAILGALAAGAMAFAEWKPTDPPNQPMGTPRGIHPGRVVWIRDPAAAKWDGKTGQWFDDASTDPAVADAMVSKAIRLVAGAKTDAEAWKAIFKYYNKTSGRGDAGYKPGEKIAIKLNLNSLGNCNTPQVTAAMVRQLVKQAGVPEADVLLSDPSRKQSEATYAAVHKEFPKVRFEDASGKHETPAADKAAAVHFADPTVVDSGKTYLPASFTSAAYLINMAMLKGHDLAGVTLCAKNHFGSVFREADVGMWNKGWSPGNMHNGIDVRKRPMGSHNPLVDLMGHKQLGGKTVLYFIDALYGGPDQGAIPARWKSAPFNDGWTASVFASLDPVAIDSVAVDFCAAEPTLQPKMTGSVDNYLHEAALAEKPPSGVTYDPEGDGVPLKSLGVHEHWNNPAKRQYSRNLGTGKGIELVTGE